MQLKNDLKAANKLLRQEIGESFENLQSLMNVNTNWRGRAQMICDLQQKVSELKEKLKEKESGLLKIISHKLFHLFTFIRK